MGKSIPPEITARIEVIERRIAKGDLFTIGNLHNT
jgi:hypothetical protein